MTNDEKKSAAIIRAALDASTIDDAVRVSQLIEADIGAAYQRPVGDKFNNYGLMASSGSYEYKALEPVTNQQDSVLERFAAASSGISPRSPTDRRARPPPTSSASMKYQELADITQRLVPRVRQPTRSSKRLTIVYRDEGCGMTPAQIPGTIFGLGSRHKTESHWHQGAFGIGGASTYRNAEAVVLVSRQSP